MRCEFQRAYPPASAGSQNTVRLLFHGSDIVVTEREGRISLPCASLSSEDAHFCFLGTLNAISYVACDLPSDTVLPEGHTTRNLRALWGALDDDEFAIAGYAAQLMHWRRTHRFCANCGSETQPSATDWSNRCPSCGATDYPAVIPAILALVHNGNRLLLAHKPGWGDRYSIIAGFVEPGESLEECVRREVREEAGLAVEEIRYVGSQPWPFPSQLMVSFEARFAGGDIAIDAEELDDARWFAYDELPELPSPMSLARRTIDRWVNAKVSEGAGTK